MLVTEPAPRVTMRFLTGGAPDPGRILTDMAGKVPPGGLAAPRMGRKYRLLAATYRLLDSRILAAALSCLDQDMGPPIAERLATVGELRRAAQKTLQDPDHEDVVTLAGGHRFSSTQAVTVTVRVDGGEVAVVPLALELSMTLGETSAVLLRGAIRFVECVLTEVVVVLSLAEPPMEMSRWETPVTTLRVPVDPPFPVPVLPAVPAPRTGQPRG